MAQKEEKLCADRDSLTGLADIGAEFIKEIKKESQLAKELGLDTTELDKTLKEASKLLTATRKRVKV